MTNGSTNGCCVNKSTTNSCWPNRRLSHERFLSKSQLILQPYRAENLTENPYFNARRSWNDNHQKSGGGAANHHSASLIGLIGRTCQESAASFTSVARPSSYHILLRSINSANPLAIGTAEGLNNANRQLVIRARLASLISDARTGDPRCPAPDPMPFIGSMPQLRVQ